MATRSKGRRVVFAFALIWVGGWHCAAAETVESVQRVAVEWAKLKEEKARVENAWANERELMQATVPAMQQRIQFLEEKRKLLEEQTVMGRRNAEQELVKGAALAAGLEKASRQLEQAGRELLQLRASLPPRLSRALELPFASLADEKLSPGERMQSVITVLERCAQFNGAITLSEETLTLAGESEKVVEVLYWGLARAYALDRGGNLAYLGWPAANAWKWEPHPEAAPEIAAAIAIHRDETEPRFVQLPVKIGGAGSANQTN